MIALLLACTGKPDLPAPAAGELIFVRGGVIAPGEGEGRAVPGERRLVERAWRPGEEVQIGGLAGVAPRQAECVPLFHVPLGDVSQYIAMSGPAPDTALAWSPDARRLAAGTHGGEVIVADGWTGAEIARRRLAESAVKQVAWSPDGGALYVAEQSPDAWVRALDPDTLADRWKVRLADVVESSPPPAPGDLYGLYTLPSAYAVEVLAGGDLLVAAVHGWPDAAGNRRNLSQLLRISPGGEIRDRWPDRPADATFLHLAVDAAGGLAALTINRSADGPPPPDLPIGGVQVLDLAELTPVVGVTNEPLRPWFQTSFIWKGLDVSRERGALYMGLGDGRVRVLNLAGEPILERDSGAPIQAGDVPIHASVGWGFFWEDGLVYNTSGTLIPYGAASPDLRPPTAHPNARTVWFTGLDGQLRWSWAGEQEIQGLSLGADGRRLVVGAGPRQSDQRRDLYGALVFDLGGDPRSGAERLEAFCATAGPVFFQHALAADGRLAVAEYPYLEADGSVKGDYQLTVLR